MLLLVIMYFHLKLQKIPLKQQRWELCRPEKRKMLLWQPEWGLIFRKVTILFPLWSTVSLEIPDRPLPTVRSWSGSRNQVPTIRIMIRTARFPLLLVKARQLHTVITPTWWILPSICAIPVFPRPGMWLLPWYSARTATNFHLPLTKAIMTGNTKRSLPVKQYLCHTALRSVPMPIPDTIR